MRETLPSRHREGPQAMGLEREEFTSKPYPFKTGKQQKTSVLWGRSRCTPPKSLQRRCLLSAKHPTK